MSKIEEIYDDINESVEDVVSKNPLVAKIREIKGLVVEAIANIAEESELKSLATDYANTCDIAEQAVASRDGFKDLVMSESENLVAAQDAIVRRYLDLSKHVLSFCERSGHQSVQRMVESFTAEFQKTLPQYEEILEAMLKTNIDLEKIDVKPNLRVSQISESVISEYSMKYGKVMRLIKNLTGIFESKIHTTVSKSTSKHNVQLKKLKESITIEESIEGKFWCVYQPGAAIFGVGRTEDEAWEATEEWADTTDKNWKNSYQISPCTEKLYSYVNDNGSPDDWEDYDGVIATKEEVADLQEAIKAL